MTDKEFKSLIIKCRSAGDKHKALLALAEQEYEIRFGNNPSEVDNNYWIDTLHYCYDKLDFDKLIESAKDFK